MKRKPTLICFEYAIPILFLMLLVGCNCTSKLTDVVADAKCPWFESLQEMESKADVILIGRKTKEASLMYHEDGDPLATISDFQIETVVQDKTGVLSAGEVISVLENDFVWEEIGRRYHVAGYTAMNTKDRYVLHLERSEYKELVYYVPLGINYGVACLGEEYRMVDYDGNGYASGEFDLINSVREETREKYMNYSEF